MTRNRQTAERLQQEYKKLVFMFAGDTIAAVAGVSESTVTAFRKGAVTRAAPCQKIADALEKLKKGLTVADMPGETYTLKGKAPWKGTTTVDQITKEKMCGCCGKYHKESFRCN